MNWSTAGPERHHLSPSCPNSPSHPQCQWPFWVGKAQLLPPTATFHSPSSRARVGHEVTALSTPHQSPQYQLGGGLAGICFRLGLPSPPAPRWEADSPGQLSCQLAVLQSRTHIPWPALSGPPQSCSPVAVPGPTASLAFLSFSSDNQGQAPTPTLDPTDPDLLRI